MIQLPAEYAALRDTLLSNYTARVSKRMDEFGVLPAQLTDAINAQLGTRWQNATTARRLGSRATSLPGVVEMFAVAQVLDCTVDDLIAPLDREVDYSVIATSAARAAGELERVRADLDRRILLMRQAERTADWRGEREARES